MTQTKRKKEGRKQARSLKKIIILERGRRCEICGSTRDVSI